MGVSTLCTGSWTHSKGARCHLPTASNKPLHDIVACAMSGSVRCTYELAECDPADIAYHVVAAPTQCPNHSDKYCKRGKVGESTLSVMAMLMSIVTHSLCTPGSSLMCCSMQGLVCAKARTQLGMA